MAQLIYLTTASLDGYIADADGGFGWAEPDEEVHRFVNDLVRTVGTHLLGRRMYEVMTFWETDEASNDTGYMGDFARIWQDADKIVYSRTLADVPTARTRLERDFDPDAVRALKESQGRDLGIGGAELAGHALHAGLVDELHLIVAPAVVGGGTRALPDGLFLRLELVDQRRFSGGMAYLRYRTIP